MRTEWADEDRAIELELADEDGVQLGTLLSIYYMYSSVAT